ncbi:hypothetical protein E2C01_098035 [Portunus trituberculatus]|uniref:Regulatory protein zeste n=1 Tax=Portunus trituberculatus TaxID=210409 RepID=A0A5B7K068_PORTR|nr:hypothetical protein [Portunus trituberculatus]
MQRSDRLQYMGEEERLLLVDLIRENRAVLSRATDARSIPLKVRTWEKVAKSLAASGLGPQRTVKQQRRYGRT